MQEDAAETLTDGPDRRAISPHQSLSEAIADRTDLPQRFVEDPVKTAILISSTETLDGFASGLSEISEGEIAATNASDLDGRKGDVWLPAQGILLHRSGRGNRRGRA